MANTTIPNLPSATSLTGSEQLEIVQSGASVKTTTGALASLNTTTGTVTSIATNSPIQGGPITTTGTISLQVAGVDNTYLAPMAPYTLKGNNTAGTVSPQDLSAASVLAMIGAGTVSYVGSGAGLTGGPITTTGTLSLDTTAVNSGTYGSASNVGTFTVDSYGRLTAASNTPISIPAGQVTGLGTMATQNANSVAITGGTVNGTIIGGSTPAAATFTTLTATGTTSLSTIASGTWNGTTIGIAYGGTGATTASGARTNLGAASSGANSDITSLSGLTTPLSSPQGGTGFGGYTTGDLLYADTSTTLARLNDVATGNALISGGVGVAPAWGKIGLTTHVSGTLPITNGGTGQTSASAAFNALSPITSTGDLILGTGSNTAGRLAIGSNGYVLTSDGTTASWQAIPPSGVTSISFGSTGLTPSTTTTGAVTVSGTLNVASGGTGATTLTGFLKGNGTSAFTAQATIGNSDLANSSVTIGSTSISLGGSSTTIAGLTTLTLTQDPTSALQASTKQYVDTQVATVSNQTFHTQSSYATTTDLGTVTYSNGTGGVGATITNNGTQAALQIDGYTFTASDVTNATRVLVKDQSSGLQNGIYIVTNEGSISTNWQLQRATDFDTVGTGPTKIETGAATFITSGTANGSTSWVMTTSGTIIVGTTALTFAQTSASGNILVNAPLSKTGNTISLGTVGVANGGTGLTTYTAYGLLYAPTTASISQIATGTSGYPLVSGGSGAAPSFAQLSLSGTGVTGTLPISSGGTGQTSASAAFNALSPITTTGDLILGNGTNSATRLAIGTNGYVLTSDGTTASWQSLPAAGVTSFQTSLSGLTPSTSTTGAVTLAGTLGVTSGGTGTTTQFTQGSIVFAGASGVYSQNNADLFWDNTNIRLGINTPTPNTNLTIVSNTQTATPPSAASLPAGTDLYVLGADAANTRITQDAYGAGNYAAYTGRQARGTAASPSASQTGDILAQYTGRGYGATAFASASNARVDMEAAENFTDTAQGTYISMHTTALGATSPTEKFRVGPSGQWGIGGGTYGTSGYAFVSGGASAAPTWSQISLTTGVTGTLPATNGGTGLASYTTGDLLYASSSTALARLADVATGNVLLSGGVGVAPSWGKVDLTTAVNGTLPVTNGGTGQASALTQYGVVYGSTTSAMATTAAGTTGQILIGNTSGAPTWSSTIPSGSGVQSFSAGTTGLTPSTATTGAVTLAGTLAVGNGGTGLTSYTTGDLLYASGATTIAKLADVATGSVLVSGGVGVAPSYSSTPTVTSLTSPTVLGGTAASSMLTLKSTSGVGTTDSVVIKVGNNGATTALTAASSGTVTIGTLNLTNALGVAYGGTGLTSTPANGAIDIGNGTGFTRTTITAGTAIGVTNGSGSITINNTGVTSLVAGTNITLSGSTGAVTISAAGGSGQTIPSGTRMTFQQTAAPTGFTKDTTYNNYATRVVSGSVGTGGSVAFTTAFASQAVSGTVGSFTLTTNEMPSHNHAIYMGSAYYGGSHLQVNTTSVSDGNGWQSYSSASVLNAGGGGGHSHSFTGTNINLAVQYVDFILATAN